MTECTHPRLDAIDYRGDMMHVRCRICRGESWVPQESSVRAIRASIHMRSPEEDR